jgi:ATP-dependent DNA helicase RecG
MKELDGGFIIVLYKDNLTSEQLTKLGFNDRQVKAVLFVKEKGRITNKEYQILNEVSDRTALRDFEELVEKGILIKQGDKKGTIYKLSIGG